MKRARWRLAFLAFSAAPAWSLDLGKFFSNSDDAPKAVAVAARAVPGCAGGAAVLPRDRKGLETALVASAATDGVRAEAASEAKALLSRLLALLPDAVLQNMVRARVTLILVPADKHVLDMPQAAQAAADLKDSFGTIDGRSWRTVDSFSNIPLPCGGFGWFVDEKSVLGTARVGNRPGYTVVHEFAHMVEKHGLPAAQKAALARLHEGYYAGMQLPRPGDAELYYPFPDLYSVQTDEFFPQMTNVWLDAYQIAPGRGDRSHPARQPAWFDEVPAWLPAGPQFTARDAYLKRDYSGNLDAILGRSRRHEPISALLRAVWGERQSILK